MDKLFFILVVGCVMMLSYKSGNSQITSWCHDEPQLNCWRYVDAKCTGFYEDWARAHCPFRCGYCPNKPPCEDTDTSCSSYHDGSCSDPNTRSYMREHCRKTCNECLYPGETLAQNTPPPGLTDTMPTDSVAKPPVGK